MILKLTLLLMAASVADLALRRASAALRHFVWTLTFYCALLLPVCGFYAPRVAGGALAIHTSAVGGVLAGPAKFDWVLGIYLAGVALCLLRLGMDILATNRMVRESRASSVRRVLISDRATVPFAWDAIVVPPGFETRDAVLAHEAAHLERGDVWNALVASVICAIYWFHPLIWWARFRMRLEADRACDDAVLRRGFGGADYAQDLIEVARSFRPARLAPGAVRASQLEARLKHILSHGVDRARLSRSVAWCAAIVCIAVAAPVGVLSPLQALPNPWDGQVFKVGHGVRAPSVLSKVDPKYPKEARAERIEGTVLLTMVIGTDGAAREIQVTRSINSKLDKPAVSAVRQWKFRPGTKDGRPVNVQASIEMNFRLL
jgi:TonB family protein